MARLRRMGSILLVTVLLVGICNLSVIVSAAGEDYERETTLLTEIGILEGLGNGNLGLNQEVTRGQFAAMIYRMLDLSEIQTDAFFSDVPNSHWAYKYVQAVTLQGYLNGDQDGRFRPDDTITTQEAVKVLTAVLGYTYPAEQAGGYPMGYLSIGGTIGVLRGVDAGTEKTLTRGETAKMIYNCLTIGLMRQVSYGNEISYEVDNESTLLTEYLKMTSIRGTVTANYWVNLSGEDKIGKEQVVIDGFLYYVGKTDIADYVGSSVRAYVKLNQEDPVQTVLYYELLSDQETIVVREDNISPETTVQQFVYMEDNKKKAITIPQDVTFIWNGKTKFDFGAQTLQPETGTVTLTMDSGVPVVISVKSYENRVVDSVSEGTKTIYYKNNIAPTNLEDLQIQYKINKMGIQAELGDLEENDILSIAQSEDGTVIDIIVSTEQMSGTITQVSDDGYAIDGMTYPISADYAGKSLELGKEGTFYFNAFGKIVYASYDAVERSYAYLFETDYGSDLSSKLYLKLLTMSGTVEEKTAASKVTLNGQQVSAENAAAALKADQLIKVQYNANGEVRSIDTAYDNTSDGAPLYDTEEFSKDFETTEMRYLTNRFSDGTNLYYITDSTPVMTVAFDVNGEVSDKECSVLNASGVFSSGSRYSNMVFYDLDADTRVPKIIVRKENVGASSVNVSSAACVVDQIYQTVDKDGMAVRGLRYYRNGQLYETPVDDDVVSTRNNNSTDSTSVPDVFKNVAFDDLQRGDVIQFSTNTDGNISVFRPLFVQKYAPADYTQLAKNTSTGYTEFPALETFYGEISGKSAQIIIMKAGDAERIFVCNQPKVYHYDRSRNTLELLTVNDLATWLSDGDVFVHVSQKLCQTIVIYD